MAVTERAPVTVETDPRPGVSAVMVSADVGHAVQAKEPALVTVETGPRLDAAVATANAGVVDAAPATVQVEVTAADLAMAAVPAVDAAVVGGRDCIFLRLLPWSKTRRTAHAWS